MTNLYGGEDKVGRYMFWFFVVPVLILLGVVLAQPIWNAPHLINQVTVDCKARHGVLIVDHGMFGDYYSCQSRLDK